MENKANILIIEDDVLLNDMTKRLLTQHGYCVISAYSGSEALLLMVKGTFYLILLVLMLPGGNSIGKDKKHDGHSDYRCVR